ncbi:MAG TPA: hypothetical protein VG815_17355 [Chloroflexota bacterium]|nr:hypothetical protein [Chloroflexota bacterium]
MFNRSLTRAAAAAALAFAGILIVLAVDSSAKNSSIPLSRHHVTADLSAFGIEFTPSSPSAGAISDQAAVKSALRFSWVHGASDGSLPSGVTVNAWSGIFTDTEYQGVQPPGGPQIIYRDMPVWLVTFSGTTVGAPNFGPMGTTPLSNRNAGTRRHDLLVNNETVIVDATTGQALLTLD